MLIDPHPLMLVRLRSRESCLLLQHAQHKALQNDIIGQFKGDFVRSVVVGAPQA
jgi:hypothetical protein